MDNSKSAMSEICARSESQIKYELANGHYKIVHEQPFIVSALGATPKKDSNKVRT
jgi:hypothetical protein